MSRNLLLISMAAALARALAARAAAVVQTTAFRRRALQVAVQSAAKRFRRGFIPRQLNLPALAGKSLSFMYIFALAPINVSAQSIDKPTSELKLYCGAVSTQIGWSGTLPYTMQMCPLDAESCDAEKRPFSLQPASGRADSDTHCWFSDEPVKFRFEFNSDYTGGRDYVAQDLVPIAFDWRGLYPDVWCLEDAAAYFTDVGGRLALRAGYFNTVKRKACRWNAPDDPTLPPPNSDLPHEVVGAWVPQGKDCPGFFDDASRTGDALWIQPHAIDRAEGACWLTGLFPLTPTLPVDALCRTAKGYERTSFTFDGVDGETMRLREGHGLRVTYKRCEKGWFVDPEQKKAADKLKGQTLSFVLDLESQMRSVKGNKTVDGSHARKIELQVGDDWTLTDQMQIGDSAAPKTFKTRFGEIAVDSAGDRATWLVEDNKLKRVRERRGYYEILSWPLNFDSRTVKCQAEMKLVPTRADGKLRTLGTDRAEYDVIKADIKGQRCPTQPLSFAVAAKAEEEKPLSKCINAILNNKQGASAGTYELVLTNACNDNILARMQSEVLTPSIHIIQFGPSLTSGDITVGKNFQKSYTLTFEKPIDTVAILHAIYIDELQAKDYVALCGEDLDETQAVACFDKTYASKFGEPERAKQSVDGCLKHWVRTIKEGQIRAYNQFVRNTCAFGIVVRMRDAGRDVSIVSLPALAEADAPIFPHRNFDPKQFEKSQEFSVLTLQDYTRNCGEFRDDDQAGALACFGKAYVHKHGEPDWVKDAQTAGGCVDSDPDVAIKACTADIAGGKTDGDTLNNRAVAYMQKGQFDLALPDLDKAIERDPKHYGALSNRGIVWMKKQDFRRAVEDFTRAIELTPMAPLRPYRQRAEAYAALGEHAKAYKDADEALEIDPKDDRARKVREASMAMLGGKAETSSGQPFDTGEKIHVRHILLKSEDDAKLAEKVLKGGADFAQTARSLSIDEATAEKGGDLGWIGRGKMLKAFEDMAFALKPGEISVPVKTQFGWHIIKRDER